MRYGPLLQRALPRKQGTNSVRGAPAQEMAVAVLRHPAGARQMAFPSATRTCRLGRRIDMQHQPCDFFPVRTVFLSIKQPQISHGMSLVVASE